MWRRDIIRVCGLLLVLSCASYGSATRAGADSRVGKAQHGWPDDRPAPESCPGSEQIAQRVEQHLGRPLQEADPSLRISTRFERTSTGYLLSVRTERTPADPLEPGGTRVFEGASCSDLAEAAALLVALSVDPLAVPRLAEAAPPPFRDECRR